MSCESDFFVECLSEVCFFGYKRKNAALAFFGLVTPLHDQACESSQLNTFIPLLVEA